MSERIEANDIHEAYAKATKKFSCSVKDLDIEVIQTSSTGILGFFKKNAVILVKRKGATSNVAFKNNDNDAKIDKSLLKEIKKSVIKLMKESCFDIEVTEVGQYDDKTVFIKLDGEDAALVIGKEGYRYNSLVTLLYNWLHIKYSLLVRLEVSEFLHTQEEAVFEYLTNIYPSIDENKRVKTKILNGILLRIALTKLKSKYPDKFIRVRNNHENKKYILIDNRKES